MYFAETPTRRVIQRPAGAHGGTGQAETSFLTTDPGAFPDGAVTSADGRYWGFVPMDNLIGKAVVVWWPPSHLRKIP